MPYVIDRGLTGDNPDLTPVSVLKNRTPEGYAVIHGRIARPGIQRYFAGEFPRDEIPIQFQDDPRHQVHLLRTPEEVFNESSIRSFDGLPLTNDHPPKMLTALNLRKHIVGIAGKTGQEDGMLATDLKVMDQNTLTDIEHGKQQLSCGYQMTIVWESGSDAQHGTYDGVQTNIIGNHVAIVDKARGGPELRLQLDDSWGEEYHESWDNLRTELGDREPESEKIKQKPKDKKMAKRKINGIEVDFDDGSVQAVDCLVTSLDDTAAELQTTQTQLRDARAEIETLKGQLAAEQAKPKDNPQDKLQEMFEAIDSLRALDPELEWKGKSPDQLKLDLIKKHRPDIDVSDASPGFIQGVFSVLEKDLEKSDQQRTRVRKAFEVNGKDGDTPQGDDPLSRRARVQVARDADKGPMSLYERRQKGVA